MSGSTDEIIERQIIERLMIKGQSALKQGKHSEAYDQFSQVIALAPQNTEVFPFRADALLRMGKKSEAEQDLDQQESPAAAVRKLLSDAAEYMNRQSYDDAEQSIIKTTLYDATLRQKTDAALMLSVLYAATERYEEALIQYKQAQTSMPDDARYVANIIGLNTFIRLKVLSNNKDTDHKERLEVARDFIETHDDLIPHYKDHITMARIAVSIAAGEFDFAARKLWTSISTNMEHTNLNLSQSALATSNCLTTAPGPSAVNSNEVVAKLLGNNSYSFVERASEEPALTCNGLVPSRAR